MAFLLAIIRSDSAALSAAYRAVQIAEDEKRQDWLSRAYITLGSVYMHIKQFDKGILYHRKSLSLLNKEDAIYVNGCYQHFAQCYLGLNETDSAFFYAKKVLAYNQQHKVNNAWDVYQMGSVYFQKSALDTALQYYQSALKILNSQRGQYFAYKKDIAACDIGIAHIFEKKHVPDSTVYYAKAAWNVSRLTGLPNEKLEALSLLGSGFAAQSKLDSAYTYQNYALALRDSIYNADKVRQAQLLSFNEDLRKQQEQEEARKHFTTTVIIALMVLLLFAFIVVVIIYNNNKKRKKAYALLQKQKEQIDNKNRELEIEAALERVRSRAMAMQKSEELREVVQVIFDQLCGLDFKIESASFAVEINETNDWRSWLAAHGNQYASRIDVPYFDHPVFNRPVEAKEKGETFYTLLLTKEEKDRFFDHYFKFAPIPEDRKPKIYDSNGWAQSVVLMNTIGLSIINYAPLPYSDKQNKTLVRFGKAFEQVYTRFLDLQKAEAQAREAQIEAALERVRSRSLAMHHSNELTDVAAILFKQVSDLGIKTWTTGFNVWSDDDNFYEDYITTPQGGFIEPYTIDATRFPAFTEISDARKRGEKFYVSYLEGQMLKQTYLELAKFGDKKQYEKMLEGGFTFPERQFNHFVFGSKVSLMFITYEPMPNAHDIFKRFGNVFEQAYIRFLDLQKAEAQAREAQIETALERVRSRSMGMQKSEELRDVIQLILDQLLGLQFNIDSASFIVEVDESNDFRIWMAAPGQQYATRIDVPYLDHPIFNQVVEAKEKGEIFYTLLLTKEEKDRFFDHFFKYAPVMEERRKVIYDKDGWAQSAVLMKTLCLSIQNHFGIPYSEEQNKTLTRFGKVFEQTYKRFLDLQKAEAQAREAQIESALERVRSRTMAMQKSEELREVIQLILDQLCGLHFHIDSASFTIELNESNDMRIWVAAPGQQYAAKIDLPYIDHPIFNLLFEAKEKREHFFTLTCQKAEKDKFFNHFIKHVPGISEERKSFFYSSAGWTQSSVLMETVALSIQNYSGIPYSEDQNNELLRFGKVFEQTYTRFLDLQKAEAQAREAVKQASIDRVRAEIASMRTTTDLEKITPLIWNELKNLQVPFIRCGVFIMDKEEEQIQVYLSTPDGKAIASFQLPYNSKGITPNILRNWQNNNPYIDHWDAATFSEWTKSLVEEGAIKADEKYSAEKPPEHLYLHFLPFLQGMLYVGNVAQLKDDDIQLVQSLANSFATAYARYEDFNKLENAKRQVDIALKELRLAQQQLIQSEKMASLGELTAGIAHEIQNPLNFVNNFSEVSTELVEELKGVRSKVNGERDEELEIEIMNDLTENLQKINHHGKRADAIVKGMLEHSRAGKGEKQPTDINALADEYLRLSYHGLRAKDKDFNAVPIAIGIKTDFDESVGKIEVVPQDIGRVLLNLYNNAFYAVSEKKRQLNGTFEPTVTVSTKRSLSFGEGQGEVIISVKDNGNGIPQKVVDKIFQPFFTTKPTGQGTGLGLSLSYDIIKSHRGEIKVTNNEGEGTEFIITLPINVN